VTGAAGTPVAPSRGALTPVAGRDVRVQEGFWGDRQRLNGDVVIDHCREWMARLGWMDNFRLAAARRLPAGRRGREFSDADVYKLVEAMCWEAARTGRRDLDEAVTELGAVIAGAQEPDGYINTRFGHQGLDRRYRDLEWGHELYCFGHLVQAGVARLRTGGGGTTADDPLVSVALRAADHVCREFGVGGRQGVDGHPVVEMALVELYRATGAERYLEQARLFVERRGRPALADIELGRAYFQDDVPVREATVLRGHAVRALYLACGAVDVAVETGDRELLEAVADQWQRTIAARTHLTGGMGSRHEGEAFGDDHELPPDRAYAETCAGVASVMLAWRLLLATGEARYADAAERTLFNVVATSVAHDGRAFFYCNPLQVRVPPPPPDPTAESPRAQAGLRAPWFSVACCPPNVARTLASLGAYVATTDRTGLQLHQLVAGELRATLGDGRSVHVSVRTDYPWSGGVTVRVEDGPATPWRLEVRIPSWADGAVVTVGGSAAAGRAEGIGGADGTDGGAARTVTHTVTQAAPPGRGGASVERAWAPGDELRVELPVRARWSYPDPRIDAVRGCVAVERGPLVYCAESPAAAGLAGVAVDDSSDPVDLAEPEPDGVVAVGVTVRDRTAAADEEPAYRPEPPASPAARPRVQPLIPYFRWGNRGPVTMRVWLPVELPANDLSDGH
jgi:uncharacterized protein